MLQHSANARPADRLGQRERIHVHGVVVDDLRHGTGGDVGSGASHGVNLRLHGRMRVGGRGWGGHEGVGQGVGVGKDRNAGTRGGSGGIQLLHGGHVGEVNSGVVIDGFLGARGIELAGTLSISQFAIANSYTEVLIC